MPPSTLLRLYAIVPLFQSMGPPQPHQHVHVRIQTDNTTTVAYINKKGGKKENVKFGDKKIMVMGARERYLCLGRAFTRCRECGG